MTDLLEKISSRKAKVAVIGLGYVGLPVAVAFAEAGFSVTGIDIDAYKIAELNAGRSYVSDIPSPQIASLMSPKSSGKGAAKAAGKFSATTSFDVLKQIDAVIICVPTPLDKTKNPDLSALVSAGEAVAKRMHPGMLVVLESTTYPGTTEELILPMLENSSHWVERESGTTSLTVGRDFYLAFSPERIDPGRIDWTIHNTPKVIGGVTERCREAAMALYGSAIGRLHPVSSPKVAEMVKLLENMFRAVNIGMVNELAIMCDRLGVDVWEVIEAASTKPFGFMTFYPGPGLGGHCIPIDPQYLAWKLKTLNYNARFIELAADVNFSMPSYVITKIADALNDDSRALKGSRILVLGVTYKENVGDLRESPALDVIEHLLEKGADVRYNDPHVPSIDMAGTQLASVEVTAGELDEADCVVITAAHSSYDWQAILAGCRLVVDTRNATKGAESTRARIVKLYGPNATESKGNRGAT